MKIWTISVLLLELHQVPIKQIYCYILGLWKNWATNALLIHFFSPIGPKSKSWYLEREVLQNFSKKKWKLNWKLSSWIREKSALFRGVLGKISAAQPWFCCSEKLIFQCWSELNQRCSEIFRYCTALNQTWNYSEILWDLIPGSFDFTITSYLLLTTCVLFLMRTLKF